MKSAVDLDTRKQQYQAFLEGRKTVAISSTDAWGDPFISYAPFVKKDGKLYIYISRIADHYSCIEHSGCIQVMMLADEAESANLFGRERARFKCNPKNVGNEGYEEIFALFEQAHSPTMIGVLRGLDFSLFELTPWEGRYVVGFGQAFNVDLEGNVFEHVTVDKKNEK